MLFLKLIMMAAKHTVKEGCSAYLATGKSQVAAASTGKKELSTGLTC